ncbi:MAG: DUF1343 domain-containing protein [Firmicutes bacterium]|nr:DUF1343 domain-containing protein [Bacillota bacterium]
MIDMKRGHINRVKLGVDVLFDEMSELLKGKKVGFIGNQTSVDEDLTHTADVLYESSEVQLVALFGPEHGFRGAARGKVESYIDEATGLPAYSLYGETYKPTPEMLEGIDALVFDIQDVGVHFYTYESTMAYCMEAAAQQGIEFILMDRPNPIGGEILEGPILEEPFRSFVGVYPVPIRHGLTLGELAQLYNVEFGINCKLTVIPMQGWKRWMWFDETGLGTWVMPSPNMPTLDTAIVYPGTCLFEGTNVSEGRGTTRPYEIIGAPYINGSKLADELNSRDLPGVRFRAAYFIPTFSKYQGELCGGVQLHVRDRNTFRPVATALHMIEAIRKLYPDQFRFDRQAQDGRKSFDLLAGTDKIRIQFEQGASAYEIVTTWGEDLQRFDGLRRKYLIYH